MCCRWILGVVLEEEMQWDLRLNFEVHGFVGDGELEGYGERGEIGVCRGDTLVVRRAEQGENDRVGLTWRKSEV